MGNHQSKVNISNLIGLIASIITILFFIPAAITFLERNLSLVNLIVVFVSLLVFVVWIILQRKSKSKKTKNIVNGVLISVLLLILIFIGNKVMIIRQNVVSNNIINGGIAAQDNNLFQEIINLNSKNDVIYYIEFYDNQAIYKKIINENGEANNIKIYDDPSYDLNVSGNYIYYIKIPEKSNQQRTINKIRCDGSPNTKKLIVDEDCSNLILDGRWLYYLKYDNYGDSMGLIYKTRKNGDGSDAVKVCDEKCTCFVISGEWIYYINGNRNISQINKKTNNSKSHREIAKTQAWTLNIVDDWIYYIDYSKHIYKIQTNGPSQYPIVDSDGEFVLSNCINATYKWLYFSNMSDKQKLYKIKTDITKMIDISNDDNDYSFINILNNNYVFYSFSNIRTKP